MTRGPQKGRLNDDDLALWRRVTDRTERLDLKSLFTPDIDAPRPSPAVLHRTKDALMGKAHPEKKKHISHVTPSFADPLGSASVQMEKVRAEIVGVRCHSICKRVAVMRCAEC